MKNKEEMVWRSSSDLIPVGHPLPLKFCDISLGSYLDGRMHVNVAICSLFTVLHGTVNDIIDAFSLSGMPFDDAQDMSDLVDGFINPR